ncbi:hypothetical protein H6F61_20555 [Cyanobacteria bacterium FACHB-472]|nr:hypothetical protein [Cyanobacteria bacterium FACHB-472]
MNSLPMRMHKAKFSRLQMSPTGNCTASREQGAISPNPDFPKSIKDY